MFLLHSLQTAVQKNVQLIATTFLSEMLDGILIFRTVVLARKTRNQRQPVGSDILKAACRHHSCKIMLVVYCVLV